MKLNNDLRGAYAPSHLCILAACIVLYAIVLVPMPYGQDVAPVRTKTLRPLSVKPVAPAASGTLTSCGAGRLDPSFGEDGIVTTRFTNTFGSVERAFASAVQADGKIVLAGKLGNSSPGETFALARYNADGSLDTSFGVDGKVSTEFGGSNEQIYAIAIQADGKIVAVGSVFNGQFGFAFARYNPDGSLDTSFDGDGMTTVTFFSSNDTATAVAIQPDGKIVAAGLTSVGGGGTNMQFAVARLNPDGTLDPTFDGDGKLTTGVTGSDADIAWSVLIQPDGRIVVAGRGVSDFAAVRYNTDGSLDTSFDGDGRVITNLGANGSEEAFSAVLQPDGKLVLGGITNAGFTAFALVRYNTDGSLDSTFDSDGKVVTLIPFGASAYSIALQTDGKIVAGGQVRVTEGSPTRYDFAAARYNQDGSLDTSFGTGGTVMTDLGSDSEEARSVSIQSDGRILLGGWTGQDFAAVRYNSDGTLDTSFDGDGKVITNFGEVVANGANDRATSVAIQPDGKIITAGTTWDRNVGLTRHHADGSIDMSFGDEGMVLSSYGDGRSAQVASMVLQPDGKIVVAGAMSDSTGGSFSQVDFFLARYNSDGSPDTTFDTDGWVTTDIGNNSEDKSNSVALQPDGKLVVAGYSFTSPNRYFAIARYHADGSLDTTFDGDGKVTTKVNGGMNANGVAYAVAVQADGKIVAAGRESSNFGVVRYNPDGSLDNTFAGDGITGAVVGNGSGNDIAYSLAIQSDGKLLLAGSAAMEGGGINIGLARFNPYGTLDTSFGSGGRVATSAMGASAQARAMAVRPDGRIVAAGSSAIAGVGVMALARFNPNGTFDTSFGGGGIQLVDIDGNQENATAIALQPDSRFVVAAEIFPVPEVGQVVQHFGLLRFMNNCEIELEEGGEVLIDGTSARDFGTATVGTSGTVRTFTIRNTGTELLPLGNITTSGTNAGDFIVDSSGTATELAPGSSTTFTVTYVPQDLGPRSAVLSVASDDPDENPFEINLTGHGVSGDLFTVSVTAVNGTVTSSPGGINCPGDCSEQFSGGTNITLTARPDVGYRFVGWEGDASGTAKNLTISVTGNKNITAVFERPPAQAVPFDYDGDGKADLAVARPSNSLWYFQNTAGTYTFYSQATTNARIATADFDGNGTFDRVSFSNGTWAPFYTDPQFGQTGDLPVPGDRDGDGRAEKVLYRPSTGTWHIAYSPSIFVTVQFGEPGDKPLRGDFDGDGLTDNAVYRPSNHVWYIQQSSRGFSQMTWGAPGDIPVPMDYDGDGVTDIAVWRPSTGRWYIIGTSYGWNTWSTWGIPGDIPVPADYDGDGKADLAIWRPSTGTWYIVNSSNSSIFVRSFGVTGDIPLASAYYY